MSEATDREQPEEHPFADDPLVKVAVLGLDVAEEWAASKVCQAIKGKCKEHETTWLANLVDADPFDAKKHLECWLEIRVARTIPDFIALTIDEGLGAEHALQQRDAAAEDAAK